MADHRGRWYTPPSRANCAATARARASAWSAPQARCRWGAQRRGGSACRLSSGEGRAVVARHGCCCDWRISLTDDGHECEAPYGAFLEGQLGQGCGSSRTVRACRELTRGNGGEGGLVKGHGRPSQAVARPSLLSLSFHVNCILGTADCTALHYCSYGDPTARSRGDKTCDASVTHPLTSHIRELSSTGPSAST